MGRFSAPTLGDLDGDGDLDLVVGEFNGTLRSYQNIGTAGSAQYAEQTGAANPFAGIDVEAYSAPTLGDLDGDGDLDAVVGEGFGTLRFFKNTGTAGAPQYVEQTGAANPFTGIDVGNFSTPTLGDLDGDGDLDLIVGANDGTLRTFLNMANRAPVAVNDALSTSEDSTLTGNVLSANPTTADSDPDGDALTVDQVNGLAANVGSEITLGSGRLTVQASGAVSFNPNSGYDALPQGSSTTESFTYRLTDGKGGTAGATTTITISGVNDVSEHQRDGHRHGHRRQQPDNTDHQRQPERERCRQRREPVHHHRHSSSRCGWNPVHPTAAPGPTASPTAPCNPSEPVPPNRRPSPCSPRTAPRAKTSP